MCDRVTDICPCFENKARVFKLHSLVLKGALLVSRTGAVG